MAAAARTSGTSLAVRVGLEPRRHRLLQLPEGGDAGRLTGTRGGAGAGERRLPGPGGRGRVGGGLLLCGGRALTRGGRLLLRGVNLEGRKRQTDGDAQQRRNKTSDQHRADQAHESSVYGQSGWLGATALVISVEQPQCNSNPQRLQPLIDLNRSRSAFALPYVLLCWTTKRVPALL